MISHCLTITILAMVSSDTDEVSSWHNVPAGTHCYTDEVSSWHNLPAGTH